MIGVISAAESSAVVAASRDLAARTQRPVHIWDFAEAATQIRRPEVVADLDYLIVSRDDGVSAVDHDEVLRAITALPPHVPIAVFVSLLSAQDFIQAFQLGHELEHLLEPRTPADIEMTFEAIHDRLVRDQEPVDLAGEIEIGSIFAIPDGDYANARRRSLISAGMGGFRRELQQVLRLLHRHPLAAPPPYDPRNSQPAPSKTARGRTARNLVDLFADPLGIETRQLLGTPPSAAWADDARPPAVLLTGESGTGKTLVARVIADILMAPQAHAGVRGYFVKVNAGALRADTYVHDLFGSAPGKWSGIDEPVIGEIAQAGHGVAFFDEIGDLGPDVQRALLTFLDDRLIRPKGVTPYRGYQHLIAATNRNVHEGARQQWFRNDLLERFSIQLEIPPLRERGPDEISQLVDFIAQDPALNPRDGSDLRVSHISGEAMQELSHREYRNGNVRELARGVREAIQAAHRRGSPLLEPVDVPLESEVRAQSDIETHYIAATQVTPPSTAAVVDLCSESALRDLAQHRRTKVIRAASGVDWVLIDGVCYRFSG